MAQFFPTVITLAPFSSADNNSQLTLALGATTIVYCSTTASITINGLTAASGNVDGMFVTFQLLSSGSLTLGFAHDSASPANAGFLNAANSTASTGGGFGAVTYVYRASTTNRWLEVGRV